MASIKSAPLGRQDGDLVIINDLYASQLSQDAGSYRLVLRQDLLDLVEKRLVPKLRRLGKLSDGRHLPLEPLLVRAVECLNGLREFDLKLGTMWWGRRAHIGSLWLDGCMRIETERNGT
ncbi:MAG: hypothetical protein B7Y80_21280 [Hyphomicrobium sp. 32-62-53]|nr:MAG: hypothetical protein B7Y80_21280 [Hyphomicrobium sp. 32-62-53]